MFSLTAFPQRKLEILFPMNSRGINCIAGGNAYTHSAERSTVKFEELLISLSGLCEEKALDAEGTWDEGDRLSAS